MNSGWNLQANGDDKDFVKAYDTVNFEGRDGITIKFNPDDDKKIDKKY